MVQKIKNIVFDFGGVLLDIDYQKTYSALEKLLHFSFTDTNVDEAMIKTLEDFETGAMNVETFLWNLQNRAKKDIPQGQDLIKAWNSMLIGWQPQKLDFLQALHQKYRIFLLSNTNVLHLAWVYNDLKVHHGIVDFDLRFFEKTYFSHLIGLRKPNPEIYAFVTSDAKILKYETLFVDDVWDNIHAAEQFGWNTYHHDPKEDLIDVFKHRLQLYF